MIIDLKNKTNEELKDIIRNGPLTGHRSAEELIDLANKQDAERDGGTRSMLIHLLFEYLITRSFTVGSITVSQIGDFMGETNGKYTLYRNNNTQHYIGGRDSYYGTEEEIRAMAEEYDRIYSNKSENTTVVFPTGDLLFANYFHPMDELPDEIRYSEKYSINGPLGRENTMKWLAENRGIAYGQLGNTSCAIYKVSDDKIYITDAYYGDEKGEKDPPGELMGTISCGVWRFEGVDKADIKKHNFDVQAAEIDDLVEVKVSPGEWELCVYYQHHDDEDLIEKYGFPLWAELNRKV